MDPARDILESFIFFSLFFISTLSTAQNKDEISVKNDPEVELTSRYRILDKTEIDLNGDGFKERFFIVDSKNGIHSWLMAFQQISAGKWAPLGDIELPSQQFGRQITFSLPIDLNGDGIAELQLIESLDHNGVIYRQASFWTLSDGGIRKIYLIEQIFSDFDKAYGLSAEDIERRFEVQGKKGQITEHVLMKFVQYKSPKGIGDVINTIKQGLLDSNRHTTQMMIIHGWDEKQKKFIPVQYLDVE